MMNGLKGDALYPAHILFALVLSVCVDVNAMAAESLEYISEHIPEVAMDNRFATLPLHQQRLRLHRILLGAGVHD